MKNELTTMVPMTAILDAVVETTKKAIAFSKTLDRKHSAKVSVAFFIGGLVATSFASFKSPIATAKSIPTKEAFVATSHVKPDAPLTVTQLNSVQGGSKLYKEFWCLKILGWNEIRNGSEHAMKAVYSVVENRKNSGKYPATYCGIMKQSSQFSFWNDGRNNVFSVEPKPKNLAEVNALKKLEEISLKVATGTFNPVLPKNVLWYSTPAARAAKGENHWTKQFKIVTRAGPHLFYIDARSDS